MQIPGPSPEAYSGVRERYTSWTSREQRVKPVALGSYLLGKLNKIFFHHRAAKWKLGNRLTNAEGRATPRTGLQMLLHLVPEPGRLVLLHILRLHPILMLRGMFQSVPNPGVSGTSPSIRHVPKCPESRGFWNMTLEALSEKSVRWIRPAEGQAAPVPGRPRPASAPDS